jgi:hypothetical protein
MDIYRHSFAIESLVRLCGNYLTRMADSDGTPYFNIFWTDPPQAAHDWPDTLDVISRQFQAAIMYRHMTGETLSIESLWRRRLYDQQEISSGLFSRQAMPWSEGDQHDSVLGDQALTLYALITDWLDRKDVLTRAAISRQIKGLYGKIQRLTAKEHLMAGFLLPAMIQSARFLHIDQAEELAGQIVSVVESDAKIITADGSIPHGIHMHSYLRTLMGLAMFATFNRDHALLLDIAHRARMVKKAGTRFGFLPEVYNRRGDIITCETCTLMDYMGLLVTLANNGFPEFWDDAECLLRNHLLESQARDMPWLAASAVKSDTPQFSFRDIGRRMQGGFAGWSSPNHLLGAHETLTWWGGPELKGKVRAFQNCCGGSGVHAFFIAWKNIARYQDETLYVQMHVDKELPEATIRSDQPFSGKTWIYLKQPLHLHVRMPDFVDARDLSITVNGESKEPLIENGYLILYGLLAGTDVAVHYPLPLTEETITIGNEGYQSYSYRVQWRGATVIAMKPVGDPPSFGYSDFEREKVACYYGATGPSPLYLRTNINRIRNTAPSDLHCDTSPIDFWSEL